MNIFLDSNVLYRDPFLTKGFHKTLNRLARHEDVKIYISKVVYEEVLRGHKVFLEEELKVANQALKKISPYILKFKDKFIIDLELQDLINEFKNKYTEFQEHEKFILIDYDADVFEYIVEMDMHEKKPFIKKQEILNKVGDVVRFNKKEIRDAIIWYSYQVFISKQGLKDCYFISNNTKEFGNVGASKSPETEPYELHPELKDNITITPFRTVKGFLTHNHKQVKNLFRDVNTVILSENLSDQIEEELNDGLVDYLVNKYFTEQISSYTYDHFLDLQPENIHRDYFMGGYLDPLLDGEIKNISLNDFEIYGDEITISIDLELEMDIEIYLYNAVYDDRDEKFQYYNTDTVIVQENIVFVIPFDTDRELDEENFSFEEYIEGIKPDNFDIEIIDFKNINHTDVFPEEYEEEIASGLND